MLTSIVLSFDWKFKHKSILLFSEELRGGGVSENACMCEAQIAFQKKVQSTIQDLNSKHIL